LGEYLGAPETLVLPDLYSGENFQGRLYALRGYDPTFRIVFMMPAFDDEGVYFPIILERLNDITVTTGEVVFCGRVQLNEQAYAASILLLDEVEDETTVHFERLTQNEAAQIVADLYTMPLYTETFLPREVWEEKGLLESYWHQQVYVDFITRVPDTDFTITTGVSIYRNGVVAFDSFQLYLDETTAVAGWLSPNSFTMRLLADRGVWER
jgi:hypothetical protein